MDEVVAAATAFDRDPGTGALVVTGSEKAFAAGAAIRETRARCRLVHAAFAAADQKQGVAAFAEKRPPGLTHRRPGPGGGAARRPHPRSTDEQRTPPIRADPGRKPPGNIR
ncbi:hypothetical protein [Kitasatospora sp. NPDC091207]|uniref:hypothetical protein n=1 Tax=Kitasatospora sp. NPDC091207 TaxID=3364083 RepID=UPI0037F76748